MVTKKKKKNRLKLFSRIGIDQVSTFLFSPPCVSLCSLFYFLIYDSLEIFQCGFLVPCKFHLVVRFVICVTKDLFHQIYSGD